MKRCAISLYLGLVLITILLFSGAITSSVAFAADGDVAHIYDRTSVTKDLEGSEGFDFHNIRRTPRRTLRFILFLNTVTTARTIQSSGFIFTFTIRNKRHFRHRAQATKQTLLWRLTKRTMRHRINASD